MEHDFEETFSAFLDRKEYDMAENALFSIVHIAYTSGWLAAGGKPVPSKRVIRLQRRHKDVLELREIETDIKV